MGSFGFYLIFDEPYGFTWDRMAGIFLFLFFFWMVKTNFESQLKTEKLLMIKQSKERELESQLKRERLVKQSNARKYLSRLQDDKQKKNIF